MSLLEKLIDSLQSGKKVSLKHSLLIASGIEDEKIGNIYLRKFDRIYLNYDFFARNKYGSNANTFQRTQALSEYLTTPVNYKSDKFLFNEVIDARLSTGPFVKHGNCVGLTCLCNALAEEGGIQTGVYKKRGHILTRAVIAGREYAIENTSPRGFNIKLQNPAGRGSNFDLISDVLSSMIIGFGDFSEKLKILGLAKRISPRTSLIYFNSALVYYNLGKVREALEEIDQAIDIDPFNPDQYKFRSNVKKWLGDKEGAKRDLKT